MSKKIIKLVASKRTSYEDVFVDALRYVRDNKKYILAVGFFVDTKKNTLVDRTGMSDSLIAGSQKLAFNCITSSLPPEGK